MVFYTFFLLQIKYGPLLFIGTGRLINSNIVSYVVIIHIIIIILYGQILLYYGIVRAKVDVNINIMPYDIVYTRTSFDNRMQHRCSVQYYIILL